MLKRIHLAGIVAIAGLGCLANTGLAQQPAPAKTPPAPAKAAPLTPPVPAQAIPIPSTPAATANAVAATVNGQSIPEVAVQRALKRVPPAEHAKYRPDILDFLIDNMLVDQYLVGQKIAIDPKDVQARVAEIQAEVKKHNQDYAKMLQEMMLSEDELKAQIVADMRWEKFALSQATDSQLKAMFDQNPDMFDGSQVRARHVLVTPAPGDPKGAETARASLLNVKKEIETAASTLVAKMPPTDPLAAEQARTRALDDAFCRAAEKHSACPSKKEGGDINWFPRVGSMVEPFAKTAFSLKVHQMSDPVQSQFGMHLILVTARKPGQPTQFDKVKEEVREVYCSRLRDNLVAQQRQAAKIPVTPVKP